MTRSLASITAELTGGGAELRIGVVSVVAASLTVAVAGGSVRAGYIANYTPVLGHTVALLHQGETWLVLGRVLGSET